MAEYDTPAPKTGGKTDADVLAQNKQIVRRMLEAFNTGDTKIVGELLDPSVTELEEAGHGIEEYMRKMPIQDRVQLEILHDEQAFPDRKFTENQLIAEGDQVILRWTMTGTHTGRLFNREPTGRKIRTYGYEWVRIRDGKIIEHKDDGGTTLIDVLRQLGWLDLLPPAANQ
jgi:predicted ester cyclase